MNIGLRRTALVGSALLLTVTGMGSGLNALVAWASATILQEDLLPQFSDRPHAPYRGVTRGRHAETRGGFYSERDRATIGRAGEKWSRGGRQANSLLALIGLQPSLLTDNMGGLGGAGIPGEGRSNGGMAGGGTVNTNTGNMNKEFTLFSWPTRGGMDVNFTVINNSLGDFDLELGHGWSSNWSARLFVEDSGIAGELVTVRWGDGTVALFDDPDNNGVYTRPAGIFQTLTKLGGGNYLITTKDQCEIEFAPPDLGTVDQLGYIVSITDRNGNTTTADWNDVDTNVSEDVQRLESITDATGRIVLIRYEPESSEGANDFRIDEVEAPDGRIWTFDYNSGNLETITHPEIDSEFPTQYFEYENNQIVLEKTLVDGEEWVYGYDEFDDYRLVLISNPLGSNYDIAYDYDDEFTTITNADDTEVVHYYGDGGILTSEEDEDDYTIQYKDYNADRLAVLIRDKRGLDWEREYDDFGNLLTETDPLANVTTNTYTAANDIDTVTNDLGKTWDFDYDGNGNLTQVTDPESKQLLHHDYNAYGDIEWSKDFDGNQTDFYYDSGNYYQLEKIEDPYNKSVYYEFDVMGRLLWIEDEIQHGTGTTDDRTDFAYDEWFRRITITHPIIVSTRNSEHIEYDLMSRVTKEIDERGEEVTNVYNLAGWLTDNYNELNNHETYAYNFRGFVTGITNGRGNTRNMVYTDRGDLYSVHMPDFTGEAWTHNGNADVTLHEYRKWGLSYQYERRNYTIDNAGRLTYVEYNGGTNNVTVNYDDADRRTSMVDGTGTTYWYYDDNDQVNKIVTPQGENRFTYDDDARLETVTEENGASDVVTTYTRDNAGRVSNINKFSEDTVITYDDASRIDRITYDSGAYALHTYDNRSRIEKIEHKNSSNTILAKEENVYDAASRITQRVTGPSGSYTTVNYEYDDASQLTREYVSGSYDYALTYDANGNRATKVISGGITETYTNDTGDKLTKVAWTSGGTSFEKVYTYHLSGRPTKIEYKSGTSLPLTLNSTRNFTWDKECRITQIDESGSSTATYAYNGVGARVSKTVGATTTTFIRGTEGAVSSVLSETTGGTTARYLPGLSERVSTTSMFYHSGIKNNFAQTNSSQTVTGSKKYDAFGLQISASGSWNGRFDYGGKFGYQTDDEYSLKLLGHRYYDASVGRFLTRDPAHDGRNWYTYCSNNPIGNFDDTGKQQDSLTNSTRKAIAQGPKAIRELLDTWEWSGGVPDKFINALKAALQKLESKASDWIAKNLKGAINREFPSQFRNKTLQEIRDLAKTGDAAAKKAWKLLNETRFQR